MIKYITVISMKAFCKILSIAISVFYFSDLYSQNISTITLQLDSTFTREGQWCYIGGWTAPNEYHLYDSVYINKGENEVCMNIRHEIDCNFHIYFSELGPYNEEFSMIPNADILLKIVPMPQNEQGAIVVSGKGSECYIEEKTFERTQIYPLALKWKSCQDLDSVNYYKHIAATRVVKKLKNTKYAIVAYSMLISLQTNFNSIIPKSQIQSLKQYAAEKFPQAWFLRKYIAPLSVFMGTSESGKKAEVWRHGFMLRRGNVVPQDVSTGKQLNLTFTDKSGKLVSLNDFSKEYLLVDFWASWCKPCLDEMPNVKQCLEKYASVLDVYAVSLDGEVNAWQNAIRKHSLDEFTHVIGTDKRGIPNAWVRSIGVKSIPANFLLDKERRIVAKNLRGDELMQTMDSLMTK